MKLQRSGNNLVLSVNDTDDMLTVQNWFYYESGECQIERIQFADGTVWDVDAIKQLVLQGTEGDDNLVGFSTGDLIQGYAGNDRLYGRDGDDSIDGGAGNDRLYGENGNDTPRQ